MFGFGLSLAISSSKLPSNLGKDTKTALRFVVFIVVTFFLLEEI